MMNDELGQKAVGRRQKAEGKRKVVVVLIYRLRLHFLAARSAALVAGSRQLAVGSWNCRLARRYVD